MATVNACNEYTPLSESGLSPFARVDVSRASRRGVPEAIYCPGKTVSQIISIAKAMHTDTQAILATRANHEVRQALRLEFPGAEVHDAAQLVLLGAPVEPLHARPVRVLTAGTADLPVAEEAAVTASVLGNRVERLYDVGVAGLHRLLAHLDEIKDSGVVIVVAGMDGALPSVVSGLIDRIVIAVPTSTGYGASFQGLAPLLGMLNGCSPGMAVVNIDNGYGAGYLASMVNRMQGVSP